MADEKLKEMSNEKLLKQKKSVEFTVSMLIGILLGSLALSIFFYINQGFTPSLSQLALLAIPLAFIPIVFINLTTLKGIKKEIQARNIII